MRHHRNIQIVLLSGLLFLIGQIGHGRPRYRTELVSYDRDRAVIRLGDQFHHVRRAGNGAGKGSFVDTIYYYMEPQSAYSYDDYLAASQGMGTDPQDTCITHFTLLAPGSVSQFMMQNQRAGTATLYLWAPARDAVGRLNFPGESGVEQLLPEGMAQSCLAQAPSDQFSAEQWLPEWNIFDFVGRFGESIALTAEQLDFWVGYRLDESGNPTIWQDGSFHDAEIEGDCRSYSTLHGQDLTAGNWYFNTASGDAGRWVAHLMRVVAEYPALPPIISELSRFSDTFAATKTISARIVELEGESFTATLQYHYGKQGSVQKTPMENGAEADVFQVRLPLMEGDTLYYSVVAEDAGGLENASPELYLLREVAPADAEILFVDDTNGKYSQRWLTSLQNSAASYYYWSVDQHRGIDSSVVNYRSFQTILLRGLGSTIVPITNSWQQDEAGVVDFLNTGGNLMLMDMDYLYAWGMSTSGNFEEGDFAFDYLGIGEYENDPMSAGFGNADTVLSGVEGDSISAPFDESNPYGPLLYEVPDSVWTNWGDYIEPYGGGISFFTGSSSRRGMAIRKLGENWKTATFTFPPALCRESAQLDTLLQRTLGWFGTGNRVVSIADQGMIPQEWDLRQNYPNPFNGETVIRYRLARRTQVALQIFNLRGQIVISLVDEHQPAGVYSISWNGRNAAGILMPSGIYFYRLRAGHYKKQRKMIYLR